MVEVKTYNVYNIGFKSDQAEYDETQFDIIDGDKDDEMSEIMNLFNDFVKENGITGVENITVEFEKKFDRTTIYDDNDGKFISESEKEVSDDDWS